VTRGDRFRVLIAGGGVAALEAMIALRHLAEERVDLTLLAPDSVFTYRPLAVAEPFGLGEVERFPLANLAAGCGATFEQAGLSLVFPDERKAHTTRGRAFEYEALLLAFGVRLHDALPGAVTFGGPDDMRAVEQLLGDLEEGLVRRVVFAVPSAVGWTLPLYELALLTAERAAESDRSVEVTLVTPEEQPLAAFGTEASETIRSLLTERGIELRTGAHPRSFADSQLQIVSGPPVVADRVLTLPRLEGRRIKGVPHDTDGFIPTDAHGRVEGTARLYAAGDVTTFPIKQGGIAAQQADAAAETIAAETGAEMTPAPFRPVLRGLVLTGGRPAYLRAELAGGRGSASAAVGEPLWWPAGKIAARYLGPYLAEHALSRPGSRTGRFRATPLASPARSRSGRAPREC
jgi:sulfide:quinone oxidoreductase